MVKFNFILILSVFIISCGGGSSNELTTTLPENVKPIAIITPAGNQVIKIDDIINFKGDSSSDSDGNTPPTYQWTFSGATTSIQSSTAEIPGNVSFSEAGTVTVSLIVTDSLGLASNATSLSVNVTVYTPSGSAHLVSSPCTWHYRNTSL